MSVIETEIVDTARVRREYKSFNSEIYDAIEEQLKTLPEGRSIKFAPPRGYEASKFVQMLRMAFRQGDYRSRPPVSAFARKGFVYVSNAESTK